MTTDKPATLSKEWLLRALITKICVDRQLPEIKYEEMFLGKYTRLHKKLVERKSDLPSLEYVSEKYLFEPIETTMTMGDIFNELDNFYVKEKFTRIIEDAVKDTRQNNGNIILTLDKIGKEFSAARQAVTKAYTVDVSKDANKIVEEYIKSGEQGAPIELGFQKIDEIVRPRAGNLFLVVGGMGGGKTISLVKMQKECVVNGIPSMYFSLEMGLIEMTNRLLAALGKFTFRDLHNNKISPDDYRKAIEELNETQTHIVTRQSESKIDLATIERYIVEHKPKVVFIDYATLIDGADSTWNAEVSLTGELKRMALQNSCLIVCAAQADTQTVASGEIPTLTGTARNKGFGWDADILLGLASQRFETDPDKMRINYAIRKSRNGGFPEYSYRVHPNTGRWEECTGEAF